MRTEIKQLKNKAYKLKHKKKWKTTYLIQYDDEDLLNIQADSNIKNLVKTMHCKLCRKYKN